MNNHLMISFVIWQEISSSNVNYLLASLFCCELIWCASVFFQSKHTWPDVRRSSRLQDPGSACGTKERMLSPHLVAVVPVCSSRFPCRVAVNVFLYTSVYSAVCFEFKCSVFWRRALHLTSENSLSRLCIWNFLCTKCVPVLKETSL